MTQSDEAIRTELLRRKEALKEVRAQSEEARQTVTLDQQSVGRLSRMDALQGQAMAQETERRRVLELKRIEAALSRLDAGEYGFCIKCGEEIEPARLKLDAAAPACIACAK